MTGRLTTPVNISKTKNNNINRAVRQIERGFKILKDNGCSVFFESGNIHIFLTPQLPYTPNGGVDGEASVESIYPECDSDSGAW